MIDDDITIGLINTVKPKTKAMLVMFEPIALPIAVSGLPCKEADAATIISGAEEPIATMVKPIIIGETPIFLAKEDAPKTNLSALHTKNASAMSKIIT
jgi:hypothetical protein